MVVGVDVWTGVGFDGTDGNVVSFVGWRVWVESCWMFLDICVVRVSVECWWVFLGACDARVVLCDEVLEESCATSGLRGGGGVGGRCCCALGSSRGVRFSFSCRMVIT